MSGGRGLGVGSWWLRCLVVVGVGLLLLAAFHPAAARAAH
jgi:hypothetical protein